MCSARSRLIAAGSIRRLASLSSTKCTNARPDLSCVDGLQSSFEMASRLFRKISSLFLRIYLARGDCISPLEICTRLLSFPPHCVASWHAQFLYRRDGASFFQTRWDGVQYATPLDKGQSICLAGLLHIAFEHSNLLAHLENEDLHS